MPKGDANVRSKRWQVTTIILLFFLLAGCEEKPSQTVTKTTSQEATTSLEAVSWSEAPPTLFQDRATRSWAKALEGSAAYYRKMAANKVFHFGAYQVSAPVMAQACTKLADVARTEKPELLQTVLQEHFSLFRSVGRDGDGEVLVTAYYEPLLQGALTRSERYFQPLYRPPPDLLEIDLGLWSSKWKGKRLKGRVQGKRLQPYFTREEIDKNLSSSEQTGKLAGKGLALVWVDSAVDAFFLHIQGSGRVALDTTQQEGGKKMLRVGYAASNGRSYRSIGKILIDEGRLSREEMTLPRLRQWLQDNPEEVQRILFANPSYVFFRELEGDPVGNIQVVLTQGRSIATDHRLFPKGAPSILTTTAPIFAEDGKTVVDWKPDVRFTVNQDTGGAIRGAGRVDLFLGFGEKAENWAGVMKQSGSQLYFIAPSTEE